MVTIAKRAVASQAGVEHCHRCGGLMVPEQVHELGGYEARCVSCGERVDPVILAHRREHLARTESKPLWTGRTKAHES